MRAFEIRLDDWMRILFGNVPATFLLEVVVRVIFVFILIVFCMRLMGKRLSAQLDRNELVAMSALAAAIGIPIQTPDRGLLPALLVALIVVVMQRLVAWRASRNERFENRTQGGISILVQDGVLLPKTMKSTRLSRERLFSQLRTMNITHLGHVSRLYFEASGNFTLIPAPSPKPGLTVLPEKDPEFRLRQHYKTDETVCAYCGKAAAKTATARCDNCDHDTFVAPVAVSGA